MKKLFKPIQWILLVLGLLLLFGCMSNSAESSYVNNYQKALQIDAVDLENSGITADQVGASFISVMNNLKSDDVVERTKTVFASQIYFNDTWHTHQSSQELGEYLKRTGKKVHSIDIVIDDVVVSKKNAYVRWNMQFVIDEGDQPLHSVGMTHLRFNEKQQIITYQDYWDGVEGFYRTLPVLGSVLNAVRKKLG